SSRRRSAPRPSHPMPGCSCGDSNAGSRTGMGTVSSSSAARSTKRSRTERSGSISSRPRSKRSSPDATTPRRRRASPRRPMTAPTSQLDRLRDLVARLTPDQIRELAALLDPEDVELLDQVVRDTFVVEANAFDLIGYTPHPGPQTELHRIPPFSEGGPWDVLYGGAMGGGKTYALLMDAVEKALRYPAT